VIQLLKIALVSLEDGIIACGFRRMASFIERLNPDTSTCYVSTNFHHTFMSHLLTRYGGKLQEELLERIAEPLLDADLVGFSSMTGYAGITKGVIRKIRERSRKPFLLWGGIHPIIHPEDAIQADVDAICTGEGELAFEEFFDSWKNGRDFTKTTNFWFKKDGAVTKNCFRPLMTPPEMRSLPFPKYAGNELIFHPKQGFVPVQLSDYLLSNGLGYCTIWSIGCPLRCTYCGNTKFIDNDPKYVKIRHPGARFVVDEIKAVREKHPHVSAVNFHDDSFMALPKPDLIEFAELWKREVNIPFAIYGVIPNYVRADKLEILTWAGMNRVRMGIQSGSKRILDFYQRPTPIDKIENGAAALALFKEYHIPPAYDIIVDNPIETVEDVHETLRLIHRLARPYILYIYSLRVIPNTTLEQQMKQLGVKLEDISAYYHVLNTTFANCLLLLLTFYKPPQRVFDWLLRFARPISEKPPKHRALMLLCRFIYLLKKGWDHLRFMDFSIIPGRSGYWLWKLGVIDFWRRRFYATPQTPPGVSGGALAQPAASG